MAMILELGQSFAGFEWIRVTAEYSNAVLVAVLPYVSDVAQKLELPVPHPIMQEHVVHCSVLPNRRVEVEIGIQGGWVFAFRRGYVQTIQSDHSYCMLQDPDEIPKFYGELKMSKAEAVELARDTLRKLSIPLESVFAEQEPQVSGPPTIGTNTVPYYYVVWPDPRGGSSVDIEINGMVKRIERVHLSSITLERPPPKIAIVPLPEPNQPRWPAINPAYARQLIPIILRAVDEYGQKLSLPILRPLTTNHVERLSIQENEGGPYCELDLTNGWRFLYEHSMVTEYRAPDALFGSENYRAILLKEFLGKWNLTEAQAIKRVRETLAKLNYPTNLIHMDFAPQVSKPAVPGIPRYMLWWNYSLEGDSIVRSAVSAEVDADKGAVKSLHYGNMAFWNRNPPIEVPMLLPPAANSNTTTDALPARTNAHPKPPARPVTPFAPPRRP